MSITSLIPSLIGAGRHRGKSPAQLRAELDEATCHLVAMATEIDGLRVNLGTAGKEIRQLEDTVRLRDRTITDLERRLHVGILAEHVIAETQPMSTDEIRRVCNQPIPVLQLREAAAAGLLGPVLNPGQP